MSATGVMTQGRTSKVSHTFWSSLFEKNMGMKVTGPLFVSMETSNPLTGKTGVFSFSDSRGTSSFFTTRPYFSRVPVNNLSAIC